MEVNVDAFFEAIRLNTNINSLVSEYKWIPAISESFESTPEGVYIALCDWDQDYQYCPWTSKGLSGYVDFTAYIYGVSGKEWTTRTPKSELRDIRDKFVKQIKQMNTWCAVSVKIYKVSWTMVQEGTERPYVSIKARAYFR